VGCGRFGGGVFGFGIVFGYAVPDPEVYHLSALLDRFGTEVSMPGDLPWLLRLIVTPPCSAPACLAFSA
jgi:hypothetical protein